MLVWYELGIAISEKSNSIKRRLGTVIDVKRIAVLIIIFAVGVVATYVNFGIAETSLQVREDIYGNHLLYYIAAGAGIFVFCGISQLIKCNKALEYIGRNSMVILVIHKFPVLFFQELLPITARRLENSNSITGISTGGFVTIVSIMASIAVGEMLKRIAPWTLGIRKNKRTLI